MRTFGSYWTALHRGVTGARGAWKERLPNVTPASVLWWTAALAGLFLLLLGLHPRSAPPPAIISTYPAPQLRGLWKRSDASRAAYAAISAERALEQFSKADRGTLEKLRIGRYVPENDQRLPAHERPSGYYFMSLTPDLVGDAMLRSGGFWDEPYLHAIFDVARRWTPHDHGRSKIVLDVGMNFGTFALYTAALGYQVHAFEMQPNVAAIVQLALRMNGRIGERVTIHHVAVSDELNGNVSFYDSTGNLGMAGALPVNDAYAIPGVAVPAMRMDAVLRLHEQVTGTRLPPIFFVKIDVEGHDLHALRSFGRWWLARIDHVVIEVKESEVYAQCGRLLVEAGFLCQYVTDSRRPHPHRFTSVPADSFPDYGALWCARPRAVTAMKRTMVESTGM
ncbi:hypothetical protein CDCA_CDCA13G3730 [Cyanidium caldarium]|uniref:Methyltransferase FkbM domain-containing protein n=1 Tax=Cyanidium caldarium TaxID=2771 RepID=A0AAV9J058_CYACA|nr:hypothetical protein CDCA_CDCA13G3730 [Cyanidium caldarium]